MKIEQRSCLGSPPNKQGGIGLIELMVSVTIGLFVLAGVVQLYLTSTQNVSAFEGSSRIQENARYAYSRLEKDITQAGNMGCFSLTAAPDRVDDNVPNGPATFPVHKFSEYVFGTDNDGVGAELSDKMVLRFAKVDARRKISNLSADTFTLDLADGEQGDIEDGQVMMLGDCSRVSVFTAGVSEDGNTITRIGTGVPFSSFYAASSDPDDILPGMSVVYAYGGDSGAVSYEIGDSVAAKAANQTCSAAAAQNCSLYRNNQEIVEGVEDIQIEYGYIDLNALDDTADDTLFFKNATEINTLDLWNLVDRVRISLTFNSINASTTNEGVGLISRIYSRVIVMHNQLVSCEDC